MGEDDGGDYPDKAVVEMHPKKGGGEARIRTHGFANFIFHNRLSFRADRIIESKLKLRF